MSELSPQETVERALAAAKSDDCVVIAEETSAANLRWAGNTLTTNGVSQSRQLTVIAIGRREHPRRGRRRAHRIGTSRIVPDQWRGTRLGPAAWPDRDRRAA